MNHKNFMIKCLLPLQWPVDFLCAVLRQQLDLPPQLDLRPSIFSSLCRLVSVEWVVWVRIGSVHLDTLDISQNVSPYNYSISISNILNESCWRIYVAYSLARKWKWYDLSLYWQNFFYVDWPSTVRDFWMRLWTSVMLLIRIYTWTLGWLAFTNRAGPARVAC